ncbi:ferredoxin-NADP+ reductase subunit alpha [Clostridia bacterium]|nr:ferredoxin-NADP+ reductase subunit alpha [Clostridia bacterium]GHU73748.1 ferredoxin-NADP+ reductase subunit alpha [Clostridia bacterium]
MYKILKRRALNDAVILIEVDAPHIAKKARAGQFIIFRVDAFGERVPLTIADSDISRGSITLIFQIVGNSTRLLSQIPEGGFIQDVVGPLGVPTETEGAARVCIVGGGVGCAIAYPQAKSLHNAGIPADVIAGFRSKDIVILEEEMSKISRNLYITTDDGSYGEKGFVTNKLKSLLDGGAGYDLVIAIGPVIMMKMISELTREYNVKTVVSLNPIMIDGTGMCGCCRVSVGGVTKFACVDGPDFDAHQVDFDELNKRNQTYRSLEPHICRITGEVRNA